MFYVLTNTMFFGEAELANYCISHCSCADDLLSECCSLSALLIHSSVGW